MSDNHAHGWQPTGPHLSSQSESLAEAEASSSSHLNQEILVMVPPEPAPRGHVQPMLDRLSAQYDGLESLVVTSAPRTLAHLAPPLREQPPTFQEVAPFLLTSVGGMLMGIMLTSLVGALLLRRR